MGSGGPRLVWLVHLLTALSLGRYAAGQCGGEHRVVGFIGDLSMRQHQLRGTIEIIDDCTFQVGIKVTDGGPNA